MRTESSKSLSVRYYEPGVRIIDKVRHLDLPNRDAEISSETSVHPCQETERCVKVGSENPKSPTYKHMVCAKQLEAHSDTGFRREENEEGEVDGKAIRGVNIIRLGQQMSESN